MTCARLARHCMIAAVGAALAHGEVLAQDAIGSTEVVQPLPGPEVARLNAALQRLAGDPQSVDALIDAGTAAISIGDVDAAIGFFGRADELSPGNPRAKLGMAAGFMRSERPIEALRLFAEAEKAGVSSVELAGDRGLAFDLVGDNAHAQEQYRDALRRNADDAIIRRLALSQAISGDKAAFEKTLLPMLQRRDLSAYRARAFGLAILGNAAEAQQIVDAVMPKPMADQIAPYLRYMPQLTKAQQAAAANLGRFPQTGQIGRDDPRLAQFATSAAPAARQAGANLEPRGAPLGSNAPDARRRPDRAGSGPAAASGATGASSTTAARASLPPGQPQSPVRPTSQAVPQENSARQGNLARVVALQTDAPATQPQDLDQAFSNFSLPSASDTTRSANAVDITRIKPPREVVSPPPPKYPERIWVQVATGRDLAALKFDWRRLTRQAPELLGKQTPHTVPWGVANRLLAGPYATAAAAREAINALKQKGIDTFVFTSTEGQAVPELK